MNEYIELTEPQCKELKIILEHGEVGGLERWYIQEITESGLVLEYQYKQIITEYYNLAYRRYQEWKFRNTPSYPYL